MNVLTRILNYLGRVLLPVRLRPSVLQWRVQSALDRAASELERGVSKAGGAAERIESGETPKHGHAGAIFRWVFHFLVLGLILALLYWVNRGLQLERVLRSAWPFLHAYWLPLLFLLLYSMGWLGWWIWELTGPEKMANEFPDIDHAFKEGQRLAADSGVDLREVPLFLVLGRPVEGEDNVMLAAQLGFKVREVPRWPEAPVRFSAGKDAAFITCSGASVLGRHISLLIEEMQDALSEASRQTVTGDVRVESAAAETKQEPAPPSEPKAATTVEKILGEAQMEGRGLDQLTEEERRVIGILLAEQQPEKPGARSRRRVFLQNKAQLQEVMARLQHLCQLIVRARRPYCPINGVLILLPLAATETDEESAQATTACELDLTVLRETLQVVCPIFAVACDAEKLPGFHEFLQRMPASQRDRRMGQRFPLLADVEASAVPDMVQEGMGWFSNTFLPALVYNLFRLESVKNGQPDQGGLPDAVAGNMRLYQFLTDMRLRRQRLTRFLTRGLLLDAAGAFFFGGFYIAGTGPDAERDRGFVSGVFQRLPENQNYVAWAADALAEEVDFRRWTRYGYGLLVLLLAAAAVLIYRLWWLR